jgi:hypothetical protein
VSGLLLAANEAEKELPAVPASVVVLVIAEKLPIVRTTFRGRLLPKEFAAVMETVATCGAEGVPLITPVDEFRVRPAGSPVAVNEVGEFVAVIV